MENQTENTAANISPAVTVADVYTAKREALARANYDPQTTEVLNWVIDTAEQNQWSFNKAAAKIGTSATVLSRIISGSYQASGERIVALISAFRTQYENRRTVADIRYVETSLSRRIWGGIEYASTFQEIVSIIGNSQMSKTSSALEYRRRRQAAGDESVLIIRMPVNPSPAKVVHALLEELGLPANLSRAAAVSAIKRAITPRHTLIVDEVHQVATSPIRGIQAVEFLRELYDETRCGLVLIGTNVWSAILAGRSRQEWQGLLKQTLLRGMNIVLPARLGFSDEQAIWQSFGLPEPDRETYAIVNKITSEFGLGRYVKRLRAGATAAIRRGVTYTWRGFLDVHEQITALESGH